VSRVASLAAGAIDWAFIQTSNEHGLDRQWPERHDSGKLGRA